MQPDPLAISDDEALADLWTVLTMVDTWVDALTMTADWTPQPRSSLATDDIRIAPYHISYRALLSLNVAVDFMNALRGTMFGKPARRHPFAQYGLVRGALENAATAVWLRGPQQRNTRFRNRLALEVDETSKGRKLYELVGKELPWTKDERMRRIAQKLLDAGWQAPSAGRRRTPLDAARVELQSDFGYGRIVGESGELTGMGADRAKAAWSACSAFAHGASYAALHQSKADTVASVSPGVGLRRLAVDLPILSLYTGVAKRMLDAGFTLYRRRVTPLYT